MPFFSSSGKDKISPKLPQSVGRSILKFYTGFEHPLSLSAQSTEKELKNLGPQTRLLAFYSNTLSYTPEDWNKIFQSIKGFAPEESKLASALMVSFARGVSQALAETEEILPPKIGFFYGSKTDILSESIENTEQYLFLQLQRKSKLSILTIIINRYQYNSD